VFSHYNLEVEEQPSGLLKMWTDPNNWFCYWARYDNPEEAWVFSNPPKRWKCGIVHLADYALETHDDLKYKDFCRAVYILSRIQKAAEPEELRLDCGNYHDICIEEILLVLHNDLKVNGLKRLFQPRLDKTLIMGAVFCVHALLIWC